MRRIRLALLAAEFLPNWGGAGTYNINLVDALKDELEIHVIAPQRTIPGSPVRYTPDEVRAYFQNKIHLHVVGTARETFLYNARFQLALVRELPRLHREYQFDLVHSDYPHMPDLLCGFRSQTPTIITVHTTLRQHIEAIRLSKLGFRDIEPSERYQLLLALPLLLTERFYLRRCRNGITVSQWMKENLRRHYGIDSGVQVIHNGVDTGVFSPQMKGRTELLPEVSNPVVLWVGRMTAAKGGYFLMKAIPLILKENPKVHFVFAGSSQVGPLKSLLDEYGVAPESYTFLGYVPYNEMPSLYSRADIYVNPSLMENLSFIILEAMSSGIAVVATAIAGTPEMISHGEDGLLVPPRNERSLAEAILTLLGDHRLRQRVGENARRTVLERFNLGNMAQQTKSVYQEVAKGAAG